MLYEHQTELAAEAAEILARLKIVYLAFQMRVGKTLTALETCKLMNFRNVLFVTKQKAISSIQKDYKNEGYTSQLTVTNYEQLHNIKGKFDCVIGDEAHGLGGYPKPRQKARLLRQVTGDAHLILLSGTPTPESYSQFYHQFWISAHSPFVQSNFYKWAHEFVTIGKKRVKGGHLVNDYSNADREKIMQILKPYMIFYTQKEAGVQGEINERIEYVEVDPRIQALVNLLVKKKYYQMKNGAEIVCDSAVKLQSKIHQVYSGTVITADGIPRILDESKAKYIREHYVNQKIAVFYKYQAEAEVLRKNLPDWTDDPSEFSDSKGKVFLSQIRSGAMGVDLSSADLLIFYNIDFSAVLYWQARARIQNIKRETAANVVWLFAKNGIEDKVLQAVMKKKQYTVKYFEKDYNVKFEIGIGDTGTNIKAS